MTTGMVKQRLASHRWEAMGPGVYRLCGSPRTWEQRLVALTLAAGPLTAASHRSGAGLLGIPGFDRRGLPEVTTPRARRHRSGPVPGVVHRWRPFPSDHLTIIDGIVSTRVARTLVDLAGVVHPQRVERAVDNCLAAGTVTLDSLRDTFTDLAVRGRKGVAVMRSVLAERRRTTRRRPASWRPASSSSCEVQACRIPFVSSTSAMARDGSAGSTSRTRTSVCSWSSTVAATTARCSTVEPMAVGTTACASAGGATSTGSRGADIAERDDLVVAHLRCRLDATGDDQGSLGTLSVTGS